MTSQTPIDNQQPPGGASGWIDIARSGHARQIVLLAFGVWLHAADELMVSTVTPSMVAEIGGETYVAWLIALYEIGSILAGASAALIVLRTGTGMAMAGAALVYGAGCVISGLAPGMPVMLAGRLVQGLGGGAMIAVAFVGVHQLVPPWLTVRAYAVLSVVWGVAAFSGPMIGALFAEAGLWRTAFHFYAAQAVIYAAVAGYAMRGPARNKDIPQQARARPAVLLARLAILAGGVVGVAAAGLTGNLPAAIACVTGGLAMIAAFVYLDGRAGNGRMLPPLAWSPRTVQGSAMLLIILLSAATSALLVYGPIILDRVHGASATLIGAILLLESVGWSIVSISLSGVRPHQEPLVITGGFAFAIAGTILLFAVIPGGPIWPVAVSAAMMGGGFGAAWAPMVRRVTALVEPAEAERTASAVPTVQRLGYALGAALAGIIANSSGFAEGASLTSIQNAAYWIFGVSILPGLAGMVAVLRFVRFREHPAGS